MSALLGARLGPYEILAPIGSGGMGDVYRARDTRLDRDVAIKVLPPDVADVPEALARFEREARAVAALNHPNILALHDVGHDGPMVYVVTELLEGETLRARMRAGRIPPRRALELLAQIARGLAAAHDRGIVHRDIKPENLFLTTDARMKILDFGVAVRADAGRGNTEETAVALTEPGMIVGTPSYMAPEQLLAQPATTRSDIFAFGLVAHEMLTGRHPFKRATAGETSIAILRDDPEPLGTVALPPGVAPLIARCLEKQAGDRPASARDLAFFLESLASAPDGLIDGRPASARAVVVGAVPIVRRRVLLASISVLLLMALLMWGYTGLMAERAVTGAIETDLERAERLVRRVQDERLTRLALTARTLASYPQLKALFDNTDAATVLDFLAGQRTTYPEAPTLIALLRDGRVLARTDSPSAAPPAPGDTWIERFLTQGGDPAVVTIDGRLQHAAAEPADAGGTVFGYIVAAIPVGHDFAQLLSEATQDEITLLSNSVVVSTLRGSQTPWSSLQAWRDRGGRADRSIHVDIGAQRFAAREVTLSDEPALSAIVAKSWDEAVVPFRRIQSGLVLIGLVCIAMAVAGAFWMTRSVARAITPPDPGQRL